MSDNVLGVVSNNLMMAAVVVYSLAMLGYAAEFAFGRIDRRRTASEEAATEPAGQVLAGARHAASTGHAANAGGGSYAFPSGGSGGAAAPAYEGGPGRVGDPPGTTAGNDAGEDTVSPGGSSRAAARIGMAAVGLTALGWALHFGGILTRGLDLGRWPWGNMYEYVTMLTFVAVTAYLVLYVRWRVRYLGLFAMIPVVLGLELGLTVLYETPGPLVPPLQSYWIAIHVTAMTTAGGVFTIGTVASVLYLTVDRFDRRVGAGKRIGLSGIARRLPGKAALDRVAYRTITFAFPIWTFAVIAGAIWAESAWGRYWGWDPKETWSLIVWVIFAAYLHARVTAGWKGRSVALIAVLGFAAFLFNLFGVNIWISGLHSYASG